MTARSDISDNLIHFIKGPSYEEALNNLLTITGEGRLIGGNGMIRGGYRCVCFTEAPLPAVARGLVNSKSFSNYTPLGLMFSKPWLYERGGRPVIYQSDAEFANLPESLRWRHVRYEPTLDPAIDFTWEREWRIQTEELSFLAHEVVLVVPDKACEQDILEIWDYQQELEVEVYSAVLDNLVLEQLQGPCPWRIVTLAE